MNLTMKYQENRSKIINIVKNHFGYTDETKDLFEHMYNNRMPNIDIDYQKFLGANNTEDFKVKRAVSDDFMEKIDSGFLMFKLYFSSFVKFYNIKYSHFKNWKIEINKNMFKLQKALTNYYSSLENRTYYASDVECVRDPDDYKRRKYSEATISDKLRRIQESISERKLPNQNLQLVITWDFADWFMCSTGETWHSCLCVDRFSGCYWHGLPALIGDPNRCMVYMTNGEKKKYQEIEVDKVIARTWGILGHDGTIYLNKSYPTKNFFAKDVELMFPEFRFGSLEELCENSSRRISKNPITPFWMPDNYSDFIYSDCSMLTPDRKIEMGRGGGHYVFRKLSDGKITVDNHSNFSTELGLSNLIAKNIDIISAGGHVSLRKCIICGKISSSMNRTEDGCICNECYAKLPQCSCCGHRNKKENLIEFEGKLYCKNCFSTKFSVCEICGKKALKEEFTNYEKDVCKVCFSKFYFKCGACSTHTRINRMKMVANKIYCENCVEEARK